MQLNTIKPGEGARKNKVRVGRGGAKKGKTAGRGHKGQKSRTGGGIKAGFEGGQMPLQRRIPKFGFTSLKSMITAEVRTSELRKVKGDVVSPVTLHEANVIKGITKHVKIILSGDVDRALTVQGIKVTKGAKAAIEKAGGKVEE